jgi:hypothetical protein
MTLSPAAMSTAVSEGVGEARWDQAADAFGEAVSFELKERVFRPFAASAVLTPPDDYWKRALSGQATLGQMVNCLLQTREQPIQEVAQQLAKWLTTNLPQFREHLRRTPARRLLRMAGLRGEAQHGSVTEAETREVFWQAADLLKALTGG